MVQDGISVISQCSGHCHLSSAITEINMEVWRRGPKNMRYEGEAQSKPQHPWPATTCFKEHLI